MPVRRTAAIFVQAMLLVQPAFAGSGPFGIATPDAPMGNAAGGPLAPLLLFAVRLQTQFYQKLIAALTAVSSHAHAAAWLIGASFLYGVFHAVGPGHGKALISSYVMATGDTRRRAIALSAAASLLQAASAIAIVFVGVTVLDVTAAAISGITDELELVSYFLAAALGAMLIASKGRAMRNVWRAPQRGASSFSCTAVPSGATSPADIVGLEGKRHGVDCACVEVSRLAATGARVTAKEMLGTVVSIGVRPCSGALIVLVFALSLHLYWAGVASVLAMALGTALVVSLVAVLSSAGRGLIDRLAVGTTSGSRIYATLELAAALLVFLFGVTMMAAALAANGIRPGIG